MSDDTRHEQDEVQSHDVVVFYYAGHGSMSESRMIEIRVPTDQGGDDEIVDKLADAARQLYERLELPHPEMQHIVSTPGVLGGKPRIKGHRISVQDVAMWHERMGMSVDEIATNYDLTLGEIYAALAYYHDHREEIDARMSEGAAKIEELKARFPSRLAEHRNG